MFLALATAIGCAQPTPELTRPNVVLLGLDTFRADHLGAYGNPWIQTPNLDALAREAIVFEDAASPAAWTLPAFASIFTGLLPPDHGATGGQRLVLSAEHTTLAEVLADAGYSTQAFVGIDWLTDSFGLDQGFQHLDASLKSPVSTRSETYLHKVLGFLEQPPRDPFFLFVHIYDAHAPYQPPAPFDGMYYQGDPRAPTFSSTSSLFSPANRIKRAPEDLYAWAAGITDIEYLARQYAAGISFVDRQVGRILDSLRRTGLMDRSMVLVLADHGEHLTEHSIYFTHRYPYEENLRVPLLVRLPGGKGARRVESSVSTVDVMATVLGELGLNVPPGASTRNLLRVEDSARGQEPYLFADHGNGQAAAVWNSRLRLIRFVEKGRVRFELYDRKRDRSETTDLAQRHPQAASELGSLVKAMLDSSTPPAVVAQTLAPEVTERLRALGYL